MYKYRALVEGYVRRKPALATLSTTNSILIETGSNTGLYEVRWQLTKKEGRKEGRREGSKQESKKERKKAKKKE